MVVVHRQPGAGEPLAGGGAEAQVLVRVQLGEARRGVGLAEEVPRVPQLGRGAAVAVVGARLVGGGGGAGGDGGAGGGGRIVLQEGLGVADDGAGEHADEQGHGGGADRPGRRHYPQMSTTSLIGN